MNPIEVVMRVSRAALRLHIEGMSQESDKQLMNELIDDVTDAERILRDNPQMLTSGVIVVPSRTGAMIKIDYTIRLTDPQSSDT